jgi:hypothetical protein
VPPPELAVVIPIESRRHGDPASDGPVPDGTAAKSGVADGMVADGEAEDSMVAQMLAAIPVHPGYHRATLRHCIEATGICAQAAIACADACLAEEMVEELAECIRVLINTADVCDVVTRVLSRRTGPDHALTRPLLTACRATCRQAREVCGEFLPIHDHCRVCAQACRAAERACHALLATMPVERAL